LNTETSSRKKSLAVSACLFVFLFSVYLFTYSGRFLSTDERAIFCAVESLVKRHELTINQLFWSLPHRRFWHTDGNLYSNAEPGQVLAAVPLYLASRLPGLGSVQTVFLLNVLITALTGVAVFLFVRRLGYSLSVALLTALIFGLGTIAWVYSKTFFREPLSAFALLLTAYFLLRVRSPLKNDYINVALAALCLGWAIATKDVTVVTLPAFAILAIRYTRIRRHSQQFLLAAAVFIGLLVTVAIFIIVYRNLAATGLAGRWNFLARLEFIRRNLNHITNGLGGLLFSPGKSLFVYSPALILSPFSLAWLWWRRREEALLPTLMAAVFLGAYAPYKLWWGGTSWGPRYLVPLTPFLTTALAPVVEGTLKSRSWFPKIGLGLLCALSVAVQILGTTVNHLYYYRALEAVSPEAPWTVALYNPRYSAVFSHLQLFKPYNLNMAWARVFWITVQVDWVAVAAIIASIVTAGLALVTVVRRPLGNRTLQVLLPASLVLPALLSVFLLQRYYDDPSFGGGPDYQALVDHLRRVSQPDDVLVLADATKTDFFLNSNKAIPTWYGLLIEEEKEESTLEVETSVASSGAAVHEATSVVAISQRLFLPVIEKPPCLMVPSHQPPLDPEIVMLLQQLLKRHRRLWLVMNVVPHPTQLRLVEQWLTEHAYKTEDLSFSPYTRLVLYLTQPLPDPAHPQYELGYRFDQKIELVGYDLYSSNSLSTLKPEDVIQLSLLWRAVGQIVEDYTVSVQLLNSEGVLVRQFDRFPADGFRRTSTWPHCELVRDNYGIVLDGLSPGQYSLIVVFYSSASGARLPVANSEGQPLGDHLLLTRLVMQP